MTWIVDLLFGSKLNKAAAVGIVLVLIFGGFQIRGCIRAKEKLQKYEQAEKIRRQDRLTDQQTEDRKHEVENYSTPDDFDRGFERLRDYGK